MTDPQIHTPTDPLVTLHDARGRVLHAAPLYSHSADEVLQTVPWDWADSEEDKQRMRTTFQSVLLDRQAAVCRVELKLRHGAKSLYECRATPVDAGEVVAMVTSVSIADDEVCDLTEREVEVLTHLVKGLETKQIAKQMNIKATTVATYKARLKEKIGVDSLAGLIAYTLKHVR